ncbi:MAG TPA: hypothetical protein VHM90_00990 [Phycisphaerae bacterium]|jgi:hypothetical protein|nr:hypothetical protein [Phycisphaerae bacterium]
MTTSAPAVTLVPVTLTGGHETVGVDRGRPVILVASGLGVTPEVFRDAFSRVRPAPAGQEPQPAQVQANKKALLEALGKYGVTNDRLDEVSNYYRYPPGDAKLWKHVDAVIKAKVEEGKVTGFVVEKAGAGYTTPPTVRVDGFAEVQAEVVLHFGKDLPTNGTVAEVKMIPAKKR